MNKLSNLETLARAATPGEWKLTVHTGHGRDNFHAKYGDWTISAGGKSVVATEDGIGSEHDVRYIAAANPETVLELCEIIREQHEALSDITGSKTAAALAKANEVLGDSYDRKN
jgi:hypothetical protein